MTVTKLYPPYVESTLPAFCLSQTISSTYGGTITIPYTMNKAVGYSQIQGFILRVKTINTGTYLFTVGSSNYSQKDSTVTFTLTGDMTKELIAGQYYKIQLAYTQDLKGMEPGYYSTVGIIKCTSKPEVSILNYSISSTNLFSTEYTGCYDLTNSVDQTEKAYSYRFDIYENSVDNLVYTSEEQIHNSSLDSDYKYQTDLLKINDFALEDSIYLIQYTVTTLNGLVVSSPLYRMISGSILEPIQEISILPELNYDNGYIEIKFESDNNCLGEYVLSRKGDFTNPNEWIEISRFYLNNQKANEILIKDFNILSGETYIYSLQQHNMWGLSSRRMLSDIIIANFEDMFLYDGNLQLRVRFNPKVSSFKNDILEQKMDTIGSKYPFIFRNGRVKYKEFPIEGLLSYLEDNEDLFLFKEQELGYNNLQKLHRHGKTTGDELDYRFFPTVNETDDNITLERIFKLKALEWLTNGEPKLFKSPTEGNYIVRLLNTTLTPETKLGRMIHNFKTTAYEIAGYNYDSLIKFGYISNLSVIAPIKANRGAIDLSELSKGNQNVSLTFDDPISELKLNSLTPGTMVYITYEDGDNLEAIQIGITGAYYINSSSRKIVGITIDNKDGERITGILETSSNTQVVTEFDKISSVNYKTVIADQFIGIQSNKTEESNDLISIINAKAGELDKIKLVNIEQARFIKREVVPLYYEENSVSLSPFGPFINIYESNKINNKDKILGIGNNEPYLIYYCLKKDNNGEWVAESDTPYFDLNNLKKYSNYDTSVKILYDGDKEEQPNGEVEINPSINFDLLEIGKYEIVDKIEVPEEIIIGNGVIAELTYQVMLTEYYSDEKDEQVVKAKNAYQLARSKINSPELKDNQTYSEARAEAKVKYDEAWNEYLEILEQRYSYELERGLYN